MQQVSILSHEPKIRQIRTVSHKNGIHWRRRSQSFRETLPPLKRGINSKCDPCRSQLLMQCPWSINYPTGYSRRRNINWERKKKRNLNNRCETENSYSGLQQKGPKFLLQRSIKLDIYTKQIFDGFQKDRRGDKEIGIGGNRE